jgi:hypothetical protein
VQGKSVPCEASGLFDCEVFVEGVRSVATSPTRHQQFFYVEAGFFSDARFLPQFGPTAAHGPGFYSALKAFPACHPGEGRRRFSTAKLVIYSSGCMLAKCFLTSED